MSLHLGQTGRCHICGGKIVLVKDNRRISLRAAMWIHAGAVRRALALHRATGPTS